VATHLLGTDAFQEVDIFGITLPVVKHSFLAAQGDDLGAIVHEAFQIARSGRPGPVLIDLPKDIANTVGDFRFADSLGSNDLGDPPLEAIAHALEMMRESRRPVIYAGGGIGMAEAVAEFRAFVAGTRIPVVSTLKALGALPTDHELFMGMMGMHGNKAANIAVQSCDLLICTGARFDDRATGKLSGFAPHARVIHIDADASEIGKLRQAEAGVTGDMRRALKQLTIPLDDIREWRDECAANKVSHAWTYPPDSREVSATWFLSQLSAQANGNTIIASDVGQHQMWVAQHCSFATPRNHLSSGGLGTMGFGLPAAIGAQMGRPDATVINVTGDGSIMMNLQELATLKRYDLPIKILLFDNHMLGMVRQWQELFHNRRYSEVDLSDNPDFAAVARAMGIPAIRVEESSEVQSAIDRMLSEPGSLLVHVIIHSEANVWPIVGPGKSNSEMMEERRR
jgi:acetolactate synthase-1/2/3 large subunit